MLLIDCSPAGTAVRLDNVKTIQSAIQELMEKRGRNTFLNKFTNEISTNNYLKIIREFTYAE